MVPNGAPAQIVASADHADSASAAAIEASRADCVAEASATRVVSSARSRSPSRRSTLSRREAMDHPKPCSTRSA